MAEPFYTSHVNLEQHARLHRRAHLPTGETVDMGVHGPVVGFYRLDPPRELALPVDYIVAATGG
jgi:hypothetical protein